MASYQKVKEETKDWGDYRKLPEELPEFPLIRRMLLGADSVVQTPRMRAFETNERRVEKFSESMDPCFVGKTLPCCNIRSSHMRMSQRVDG